MATHLSVRLTAAENVFLERLATKLDTSKSEVLRAVIATLRQDSDATENCRMVVKAASKESDEARWRNAASPV